MSCSTFRQPTLEIAQPTIVRVPGPTKWVEIDASLVEPTPMPVMPMPLCVSDGWPVLCDSQLAAHVRVLEGALQACNGDKRAVAELGAPEAD